MVFSKSFAIRDQRLHIDKNDQQKEEVDRYDYFADQQRSESIVNDKENREENYRFQDQFMKEILSQEDN